MIDGVTGLFGGQINSLHVQVKKRLEEAGIDVANIPGFDDLFDQDEVKHPFFGLETQYQQLKFYKTHFNFIVRQ